MWQVVFCACTTRLASALTLNSLVKAHRFEQQLSEQRAQYSAAHGRLQRPKKVPFGFGLSLSVYESGCSEHKAVRSNNSQTPINMIHFKHSQTSQKRIFKYTDRQSHKQLHCSNLCWKVPAMTLHKIVPAG